MAEVRFRRYGAGQDFLSGHPVVFLPGWGFDGRIVGLIEPAVSWWAPDGFLDPDTIAEGISRLIEDNGWSRITLVGWSLGARLAHDYAVIFPERIAGLWLLAMRRSWPEEELAAIRQDLAIDRDGFLRTFYRKCFLGYRHPYRAFTETIQDDYLAAVDDGVLARGLACLGRSLNDGRLVSPADTSLVSRIVLVHGRRDVIAPVNQRFEALGCRNVVFDDQAHAVFLVPGLLSLLDKEAVRSRFDGAAGTYDQHADVQVEVAEALAAMLPATMDHGAILEIGCGTGNLTVQLATRYPHCPVLALDFAPAMLQRAQKKIPPGADVSFLCQDAEAFVREDGQRFSLIVSNATLQWFADLASVFPQVSERLVEDGMFCFSIFGPQSLGELAAALVAVMGEEVRLPSEDFVSRDQLVTMLERSFSRIDCRELGLSRTYASFPGLLDQLRKTGTSGPARRRPVFTRRRLRRIEDWFITHYGGFVATYQVFLFRCQR